MNPTKTYHFPFSELCIGDIFVFENKQHLKFIKTSRTEMEVFGQGDRFALKKSAIHSTKVELVVNPYD